MGNTVTVSIFFGVFKRFLLVCSLLCFLSLFFGFFLFVFVCLFGFFYLFVCICLFVCFVFRERERERERAVEVVRSSPTERYQGRSL